MESAKDLGMGVAVRIIFEGPAIGRQYIALLPGGKIRHIGIIGYMDNPLLDTLLLCMVDSHKKPGEIYFASVAPGAVLAEYSPEVHDSMRDTFRAAQFDLLPVKEKEIVKEIDFSQNWLMPAASC